MRRLAGLFKSDPSWALFLCAVFASGFSMPLARACVALSALFLLPRNRRASAGAGAAADAEPRPRVALFCNPAFVGFAVYLAVAVVVSAVVAAVNTDPLLAPGKGFSKITKLLWYFIIPLGAYQISSAERAAAALKAFVAGCALTALGVIFINPVAAWVQVAMPHPKYPDSVLSSAQVALRRVVEFFDATDSVFVWIRKGYRAKTFSAALAKLGTMQDSQRLMTALPAALSLAFLGCGCRRGYGRGREYGRARKILRFALLPAVIFLALALTLKRGPLLFGVAGSGLCLASIAKLRGGRRAKAALFAGGAASAALAAVLVMAIPAARQRFSQLPEEFSVEKGGRAAMWKVVAPELRREHPFGIGFRALTNEKMRSIAPQIEARQVHLHSVPVQSLVDFGYLGIAAWAAWMLLALRAAWRCPHPAPFAMLAALAGYGLMEYNIADGEVVLLYSFAMALASSSIQRSTSFSSSGSSA